MKTFLNFTVLYFLTISALGQTNWRDTSNGLRISYPDTCVKLQKQANLKILPGTNHSRPLIIANGIIIRGEEVKEKLVDTIYIIKCPQSFEKFGNIGSLGVIYLETTQTFDPVPISNVAAIKQSHGSRQKIIYAINGYLFADTGLTLSRKAIKKVDILKGYKLQLPDTNEEVTCISIWTITRKEIKDDNSLPKPCRGVGFAAAQ
ncbi:MAG: hypothetical protein ABIN97_00530 [Ginsengibacter sp.]